MILRTDRINTYLRFESSFCIIEGIEEIIDDRQLGRRVVKHAMTIGVNVLDHCILGGTCGLMSMVLVHMERKTYRDRCTVSTKNRAPISPSSSSQSCVLGMTGGLTVRSLDGPEKGRPASKQSTSNVKRVRKENRR